MRFDIKRESFTLPVNGIEETWVYLSLYDNKGELVSRSTGVNNEQTIRHVYDGLTYVSNGFNDEVLITYDSLIQKFK